MCEGGSGLCACVGVWEWEVCMCEGGSGLCACVGVCEWEVCMCEGVDVSFSMCVRLFLILSI